METIVFNVDRHTGNFGVLRSQKNGEILSMAPNYDNNLALIARETDYNAGKPSSLMVSYFTELLEKNEFALTMFSEMEIPEITEKMVWSCIKNTQIQIPETVQDYVVSFIINSDRRIRSH